jgi:hypothetical protein
MTMLTINQILKLQTDFPTDMIIDGKNRNTKLMFHKVDIKRIDINPHFHLNGFQDFQKEHHNTFFANTSYILSFWYEGKVAEFIGTYRLGNPTIDKLKDSKTGKQRDRYFFHKMEEINFLAEFKNRLIIKWTNPSANYGRWIDDEKFEVYSIKLKCDNNIGKLPKNYYEINLSFRVLQKLFDYSIDNFEWHDYLTKRSGVYLILDKSDGQQYIGSAYGVLGFWGRWQDYATTGHGGNKGLKNKDFNNFEFSILYETLNTIDKEKIITIETKFKNNLGTKVHGLNNN